MTPHQPLHEVKSQKGSDREAQDLWSMRIGASRTITVDMPGSFALRWHEVMMNHNKSISDAIDALALLRESMKNIEPID